MAVKVVDASAVAALLFGEPEADAVAAATGLTSYDASYLWVARRLGAELVTLDRQLEKAAAAPHP